MPPPDRNPADYISLPMKAGDAILFDQRLLHAAVDNRSAAAAWHATAPPGG